jgi:high-affinity Fe2+/Pb2+ permease
MQTKTKEKIWTWQFILGLILGVLGGVITTMFQNELINFKNRINISSFYIIIIIVLIFLTSSYLIINNRKWRPRKTLNRIINHFWFSALGIIFFFIFDKEKLEFCITSNGQVKNDDESFLYYLILSLTLILINLSFFCFYRIKELKTYS